jgi:hypothetical protein
MACFHIITAIIGAGVLGLPHALSMLGLLGGAVALVAFFAVTLVCSFMLSDMYEFDGVRHGTYGDAVINILGEGRGRQGGWGQGRGAWRLASGWWTIPAGGQRGAMYERFRERACEGAAAMLRGPRRCAPD